MRIALLLSGLIIIGLGVAAFTGKLEFTQQKEVVKIGDFSAKVDREREVPQWLGGLGVVAGLGLVVLGITRKN